MDTVGYGRGGAQHIMNQEEVRRLRRELTGMVKGDFTQIEVDGETAQTLVAHAAACGLSPAEYLRSILPTVAPSEGAIIGGAELDNELESLVLALPTLPDDFSRADIYEDHG